MNARQDVMSIDVRILAVKPHPDQATNERFPRPVVCAWCGNRHRSILPSDNDRNTQGAACASSVFQVTEEVLARVKDRVVAPYGRPSLVMGEWLVQGHYGSSDYDCQLFRFVQTLPTAAADPVCDNCIGERLSGGDLKQIDDPFQHNFAIDEVIT